MNENNYRTSPIKASLCIIITFALLTTVICLWKPVQIRYYLGCFRSKKSEKRIKGTEGLLRLKAIDVLGKELDGGKEEAEFLLKYWKHYNEEVNLEFRYSLRTPLHIAAEKGYRDAAELLIIKGADINRKDSLTVADTPLHFAAEEGNKGIVELLISKGADLNATDVYGGTPLQNAAWRGKKEVVALLVDKGADMDLRGNQGFTALLNAITCKHYNTALFLINRGANVNIADDGGNTPLHYAVSVGNIEIVKALIAKGADVNPLDEDESTPIDCAMGSIMPRCKPKEDIIRYLVKFGAKTSTELNSCQSHYCPK